MIALLLLFGWTTPVHVSAVSAPTPRSEVPQISVPLVVPVAPPTATQTRVTMSARYDVCVSGINWSGSPVWYDMGSPLYDFELNHAPLAWRDYYPAWLTVHAVGLTDAAATARHIAFMQAGAANFHGQVSGGTSFSHSYSADGGTLTWIQSARPFMRDAGGGTHTIYLTPRGDYGWSWGWQLYPPGGWSHSPLSHTEEVVCSVDVTVEHFVP